MVKKKSPEQKAKDSPENITFSDLCYLCDEYFGKAAQNGTSHRIYKTPWHGSPYVNIQKGKNGKAKVYQVKQVTRAIEKIKVMNNEK